MTKALPQRIVETLLGRFGETVRRGPDHGRADAPARWEDRTRILNRAGHARYEESTSRKLGDCPRMLIDRYRGLRLRKPHQLSRLLENLLKEELRLRP